MILNGEKDQTDLLDMKNVLNMWASGPRRQGNICEHVSIELMLYEKIQTIQILSYYYSIRDFSEGMTRKSFRSYRKSCDKQQSENSFRFTIFMHLFVKIALFCNLTLHCACILAAFKCKKQTLRDALLLYRHSNTLQKSRPLGKRCLNPPK